MDALLGALADHVPTLPYDAVSRVAEVGRVLRTGVTPWLRGTEVMRALALAGRSRMELDKRLPSDWAAARILEPRTLPPSDCLSDCGACTCRRGFPCNIE